MVLAAVLLSGCASAPPPNFPSSHPASPEAPESRPLTRVTSLRADEVTRKTDALLTAARKEQERWDATGPVSGTPSAPADSNHSPTAHEHP